jgi:hypothetical protein
LYLEDAAHAGITLHVLYGSGVLTDQFMYRFTLHADLDISYVHEVIHQKCNKHHTRLGTHENPLLKTTFKGRKQTTQKKLAN